MGSISVMPYAIFQGIKDSAKGLPLILKLNQQIQEKHQRKYSPRPKKLKPETEKNDESKTIAARTLHCCVLNGAIFGCSIILFEFVILQCLNYGTLLAFNSSTGPWLWGWMSMILRWLFSVVWVIPLFFISKLVNALWYQEIADMVFEHTTGRVQSLPRISDTIADVTFSVVVQTVFLIQSLGTLLIPIDFVNQTLYIVHMSLLYSLYSFEYKWCNLAVPLYRRLTVIEKNWPYFLGFGSLLTIITSIPSYVLPLPSPYIVSGCIFAILFPFFIISGIVAEPVTGSCDIPFPVFRPSVYVSNLLFNGITWLFSSEKQRKLQKLSSTKTKS